MNNRRRLALGGSLLAAATAGVVVGTSISTTAGAAAAPSPSPGLTAPSGPGPGGPPPAAGFNPQAGGHVGANGVKEVLLTGDTATKVRDAALGAEPGATVIRVENDAEGYAYEAHMTKADGSPVTVKVNSDFSVAKVENGM